jgi:hypothetical protein
MSRWLGNRGRIENEEMMTVNDDDVLSCLNFGILPRQSPYQLVSLRSKLQIDMRRESVEIGTPNDRVEHN